MKEYTSIISSALIALLLAVGIAIRTYVHKTHFDSIVQNTLRTSDGYDQKFIETVHNLENELASRASFGYKGRKDPMTGKKRHVVIPTRANITQNIDTVVPKKTFVDPVKLTAIIFDDENNKFTAIVMNHERSYSVEINDRIADRVITKITEKAVYMESKTALFRYDIYGKSTRKLK